MLTTLWGPHGGEGSDASVHVALAEANHHTAPRGQKTARAEATNDTSKERVAGDAVYFELFDDDTAGLRPGPVLDPRPQERVLQHTVEHEDAICPFRADSRCSCAAAWRAAGALLQVSGHAVARRAGYPLAQDLRRQHHPAALGRPRSAIPEDGSADYLVFCIAPAADCQAYRQHSSSAWSWGLMWWRWWRSSWFSPGTELFSVFRTHRRQSSSPCWRWWRSTRFSRRPSWQPVTGAAQRRRGRRFRAAWRHEQQSIAQALAAFTHHSAPRRPTMANARGEESEMNNATGQKTPPPRAASTVYFSIDDDRDVLAALPTPLVGVCKVFTQDKIQQRLLSKALTFLFLVVPFTIFFLVSLSSWCC